MKNDTLIIYCCFIIFFFSCYSQKKEVDDNKLLNSMAEILNQSIPIYKEVYKEKGFYVSDKQPKNFFVYDLINIDDNLIKSPVNLKNGGIYHFSALHFRFSYSHIAVIIDGELKIFSFLNCDDKGDKIEDVISYLKKNFNLTNEVLNQVKNYRKYGVYYKVDSQEKLQCERGK
ncbi:hypothetical protein [uncultured Tenacibaculum sp.]|uniref:hypothetical protein n=1 Tax=uncultured Tenacibaculum sp. TaxID=174713 RepID=UPI0026235A30|nr:hypothetical protein [uncultured Tenacibaculum sp.]